MERQAVLDKVEENVEKLQLELLKQLNKLNIPVHQYYNDMKGVKERIASELKSMQCWVPNCE